jgi:hypothetical protein
MDKSATSPAERAARSEPEQPGRHQAPIVSRDSAVLVDERPAGGRPGQKRQADDSVSADELATWFG